MNKKILLIMLIMLFFSCKSTEYVESKLPEYEFENIERPILHNKDSYKNQDVIALLRYCLQLEIQIGSFKTYYNRIRQLK